LKGYADVTDARPVFAPFGLVDGIALALLLLGWPLIGYLVEHEGKRRSTLMPRAVLTAGCGRCISHWRRFCGCWAHGQ